MPSSEKLITRISTSCLQVRGDTPPPSPQHEPTPMDLDEDNMMIRGLIATGAPDPEANPESATALHLNR